VQVQLGMVGLGRMGGNMVRRLLRDGHDVVVFDREPDAARSLAQEGARASASPAELSRLLSRPEVIWMMVPAGTAVDETLDALLPHLQPEAIVVDGGNSHFKASVRRAELLRSHNMHFVDVGTSGGVWGLELGYCLMVGGDRRACDRLEPALTSLAAPHGYLYTGSSGTGHFTKMVHNGIEYGLMQAYAEGFELLQTSEFALDLPALAELWNHGSVIRSWLLELTASALQKNPTLEGITGYVEDSGEGRWTVEQAIETAVPLPVMTMALMMRFRSRQADSFGNKLLAALRHEFGGHDVRGS
jgi:6-phosphogluconate dehydrogenase